MQMHALSRPATHGNPGSPGGHGAAYSHARMLTTGTGLIGGTGLIDVSPMPAEPIKPVNRSACLQCLDLWMHLPPHGTVPVLHSRQAGAPAGAHPGSCFTTK